MSAKTAVQTPNFVSKIGKHKVQKSLLLSLCEINYLPKGFILTSSSQILI